QPILKTTEILKLDHNPCFIIRYSKPCKFLTCRIGLLQGLDLIGILLQSRLINRAYRLQPDILGGTSLYRTRQAVRHYIQLAQTSSAYSPAFEKISELWITIQYRVPMYRVG